MIKEESSMQYALKLLAYRPRSVYELTLRLKKRNFPEEDVCETIAKLQEWGYLNDNEFAENWIQNRMLNKPMGALRLREELRKKGISPEIINAKIEEAFAVSSEFDIARALASSKLTKSSNWEKIARMLIRRGFSYDTVESVRKSLDLASDRP